MTFYSLLNNSKLDIKSNMPKKYERKMHQLWTEETMTKAIDEVTSGFSIRGTAKKYGMAESVSLS